MEKDLIPYCSGVYFPGQVHVSCSGVYFFNSTTDPPKQTTVKFRCIVCGKDIEIIKNSSIGISDPIPLKCNRCSAEKL